MLFVQRWWFHGRGWKWNSHVSWSHDVSYNIFFYLFLSFLSSHMTHTVTHVSWLTPLDDLSSLYGDSSLLTFLLTPHDSFSLYNDSFLVPVLPVVAAFLLYINPIKLSSTFLRLVFVYLLVNTIVLSLHSCVIPLPLPFTLIVLNLGQSPWSLWVLSYINTLHTQNLVHQVTVDLAVLSCARHA